MHCPLCKEKIEYVNVFSQCIQQTEVNEEGKILEYGIIEEISGPPLNIECPHCGGEITDYIKE